MTRKTPSQTSFTFRTHGGVREGAGRRPKGRKPGMSHRTRRRFHRSHPLHVTIRIRRGLPSLRTRKMYAVIRQAFLLGGDRANFRVCHYSILRNHLHLICEATAQATLARGMQGLQVRLAKGINKLAGTRGTVFVDRYHASALTKPRQVRYAIRYALCNARKHAAETRERLPARWVDAYSSGFMFDGWRESWARPRPDDPRLPGAAPIAAPNTWLLRTGWRKAGLIGVADVPGSTSSS